MLVDPLLLTLSLLLLGVAVVCAFTMKSARHGQRKIDTLEREQEAIVVEERRLFRFLHTLGAAITQDHTGGTLHRLIVHGAMDVTGAAGGALYTLDEQRQVLVPRFVSDECVPLIDLTPEMVAEEQANPGSLLSTLRLHAVPAAMGLPGSAFTNGVSERVDNLGADARLPGGNNALQAKRSIMIGGLVCGQRTIGVLAVNAPVEAEAYSANDLEVYTALVEQAAFALAHAQARQEAQSKRQIEAELHTASEVQRILLPQNDPPIDGWVVAGRNRPARILSGDFYDYLSPDAEHFGAVIADVSGKGFPAALVAATTRSALQAHVQSQPSPSRVLAAVNRQIAPDIRQDMFISMIYLEAPLGGSTITLARAGHPNPFVWRKSDGRVERIQSAGMGVGLDDGDVFERVLRDVDVEMQSGDVMLLYTDGIDEAVDLDGDEFGTKRIEEVLAKAAPKGAQAAVDELLRAVNEFVGGRASTDDITVLALQKS